MLIYLVLLCYRVHNGAVHILTKLKIYAKIFKDFKVIVMSHDKSNLTFAPLYDVKKHIMLCKRRSLSLDATGLINLITIMSTYVRSSIYKILVQISIFLLSSCTELIY